MAEQATIRHRIDCLVRLLDTTTGRPLPTPGVRLHRDGVVAFPLAKGDGYFLYLNTGRHNFTLTVQADGYETQQVPIRYEELSEALPAVDVHMIPTLGYFDTGAYYTLEGEEKGLLAIEAAPALENACLMRDYDKRKNILTIFNPHQLELDKTFYAIVNPDDDCYEAIEIEKNLSFTQLRPKKPLEKEFSNYFPLCRRVFGRVDEKGRYLLRMRAGSGGRLWIVRYVTAGGERFEAVDFGRDQGNQLRAPPG